MIKKMGEDGACLFRAVADQLYGDEEMHQAVRTQCLDYIVSPHPSPLHYSFSRKLRVAGEYVAYFIGIWQTGRDFISGSHCIVKFLIILDFRLGGKTHCYSYTFCRNPSFISIFLVK